MARRTKINRVLKLTEHDIDEQLCDFMRAEGWRVLRMQSGLMGRPTGGAFRMGEPGMPDRLFLRYERYPGEYLPLTLVAQLLWVEVKRPGGRLSPAQEAWIEQERRCGAIVLVVDDIDEFREWYRQEIG